MSQNEVQRTVSSQNERIEPQLATIKRKTQGYQKITMDQGRPHRATMSYTGTQEAIMSYNKSPCGTISLNEP